MEELKELLSANIDIDFISATISGARDKEQITKVKVRPVQKQGTLFIQCEELRNNQAFHFNYEFGEAPDKLMDYMKYFKQMVIETKNFSINILVSKKGKVTIKKKKQTKQLEQNISHNKQKNYILKEGTRIPFLVDLGVMDGNGKVVKSKFDKFRQINRFLEFIEDILPQLDKKKENTILDFGCGKSYLTFAMYYYLHEMKGYEIRIIGLDLKKEVIEHCAQLKERYGYDKLEFLVGDISEYEELSQVDMVVTLHACDTATDYALAKAVKWGAKVILSVPCCQHELNGQIENEILNPILSYGLLKERMAALITDGMRAQYLNSRGYDTQILEFIDMEHTPKNILIRGVKTGRKANNQEELSRCEEFLHISPKLGNLLGDIKGE